MNWIAWLFVWVVVGALSMVGTRLIEDRGKLGESDLWLQALCGAILAPAAFLILLATAFLEIVRRMDQR